MFVSRYLVNGCSESIAQQITYLTAAFSLQLPRSLLIYSYTDFMAFLGCISKISQALILSIKQQAHVTN
jgi:hypothetical protein